MIKPKVGDYIVGSIAGRQQGMLRVTEEYLVDSRVPVFEYQMTYIGQSGICSSRLPILGSDRFATEEEILEAKLLYGI